MNNLEVKIVTNLTRVLVTPYNWSLLLITAVIFYLYALPYYNNNYDMPSTFANYLILFSGGSLIAKYLRQDRDNNKDLVGEYAVLSLILSIATLLLIKTTLLYNIASITLVPVNILVFLLLLKNIFLSIQNHQ